jgi:F-type H+-transporting ATPase subunit delta
LAQHSSRSVARIYATALTEIGRQTGSLGVIGEDLRRVLTLYDGDAFFRGFFTSPRLDRAVKWKAVSKAFAGKVGRPTLGLLKVLIDKGREPVFDNVVDEFEKLKDVAENRVHAHLVVARPLVDEIRRAMTERLERASGKKVTIHERVDPAVLGGASIRVGDRVIDRTLRTKLAAMKKQLLTTN